MKEKLKNCKAFGAIKKFYSTHIVGKIFLTVVIVALVAFGIYMIPVMSIKGSRGNGVASAPLSQITGAIAKDSGVVTVAENGGKKLYINSETLELIVEDEATGKKYSSVAAGVDAGTEQALLSVKYLGEDNNVLEWNSTDNCVAFGSYEINAIADGVQIRMNFNEGESNRFYEYLPKKMSISEYDDLFKAGINAAAEAGTITEKQATKYLQTLSLVYKKSIMEECYAVTYTGVPPASAVTQMIEVAKLVGYTQEMLLSDADTFGFSVTFTEPANFDITVEATLENGELVVRMPAAEMVMNNDFHTIQNVKLLPNFGCVSVDQCEEGYFLIPDGSGALMGLNSFIQGVKDYSRPVYDNDFYTDYYYMPEYGEEIEMPVFGALYGPLAQTEKGFLAIIEEGAQNAYINAKVAGTAEGASKYNKVYASFDINQYTRVKINGRYSNDAANYLVDTGMQDFDCTVRYIFYGENATYFDMAKDYQSYLCSQTGESVSYDDGEAKLYLEFIGALTLQERFVGIPYDSIFAMTTIDEMTEIMKDLSDVNIAVQYDGAFNGGMDGSLNNRADITSAVGSKNDLKDALSYAQSQGIDLYLSVAPSKVGDSGNGFMPYLHATRDYANETVKIYRYMPAIGILSGDLYDGIKHKGYYQLSPVYLSDVVEDFIAASIDYSKIAVTDIAGMPYADFRFNSFVTGAESAEIIDENLTKLDEAKELALRNPYITNICYGEIATDVSRESSDYATFAYTIPFKQLVMNGLTKYTTEDVNISSDSPAYFVLQAAELAAYPKFILTSESVTSLKYTDYHYLICAQYDELKDKVKEVYEACNTIRSQIGTEEIVAHEIVADKVYKTTYANGKEVFVNYNLYDVELSDGTALAALDYLIKEGK